MRASGGHPNWALLAELGDDDRAYSVHNESGETRVAVAVATRRHDRSDRCVFG